MRTDGGIDAAALVEHVAATGASLEGQLEGLLVAAVLLIERTIAPANRADVLIGMLAPTLDKWERGPVHQRRGNSPTLWVLPGDHRYTGAKGVLRARVP